MAFFTWNLPYLFTVGLRQVMLVTQYAKSLQKCNSEIEEKCWCKIKPDLSTYLVSNFNFFTLMLLYFINFITSQKSM